MVLLCAAGRCRTGSLSPLCPGLALLQQREEGREGEGGDAEVEGERGRGSVLECTCTKQYSYVCSLAVLHCVPFYMYFHDIVHTIIHASELRDNRVKRGKSVISVLHSPKGILLQPIL